MDALRSPQNASLTNQERADVAREQLTIVEAELREARKVLQRDWPSMTPRERSAQSRIVREWEMQERTLIDEIEMNLSP
jgi:hypothetical protein